MTRIIGSIARGVAENLSKIDTGMMPEHEPEIQHDPSMYPGLPFVWFARTDAGRCRPKNEDSFLVEPEIGLFLVSDGMGGHPAGEVASDFVTQNLSVRIETALDSLRSKSPRAIRKLLKRSIRYHNREVFWEGLHESGCQNMGATVVLCLVIGDRAFVVNLGDSRLYRFRMNRLSRISQDHSVVNELIEMGRLDPDKAAEHAASGQITQYMGMDDSAHPHIRTFQLHPKDCLLLCSDGLTDMLSDSTIEAILCENKHPQQAVQCLVDQANQAGGHDNITVVLVEWIGKAVQ